MRQKMLQYLIMSLKKKGTLEEALESDYEFKEKGGSGSDYKPQKALGSDYQLEKALGSIMSLKKEGSRI